MKILVVCTRMPAANKNGDQVLSYHRLCYLAQRHTVHVLCFSPGDNELERRVLEMLGIVVHTVPWQLNYAAWFLFKALFNNSIPFQCAFYTSFSFQRLFDKVIKEFNPDVLCLVTIRTACNIKFFKGPLYIDLVDSMGLNYERRSNAAKGIKRFFFKIESQRALSFERSIVLRAQKSFLVSSLDKVYIGLQNISVLPLGIDLRRFVRSPKIPGDCVVIIFSGNMFYGPNIEAVLWFVKWCWHEIKLKVPGVKLMIAGSNPIKAIKKLESDASIEVTGRVESMATVLNASQVSIAPMQSGSGMQFKILEAMACGVPVVATSIGLGAIGAVPGQNILIGDRPEDFIRQVLKLLKEPDYRLNIAEAGYKYVLENNSWDLINRAFSVECSL